MGPELFVIHPWEFKFEEYPLVLDKIIKELLKVPSTTLEKSLGNTQMLDRFLPLGCGKDDSEWRETESQDGNYFSIWRRNQKCVSCVCLNHEWILIAGHPEDILWR